MKSELNFKHKIDGFPFEEKKEKQQPLAVVEPTIRDRYDDLADQKTKALREVKCISNKVERFQHVFAFAESYQTVSDRECKKFYKENPEVFAKEKRQTFFGALVCALFASSCFVTGHELAFKLGKTIFYQLAGGLMGATGGALVVIAVALFGYGIQMCWKGALKSKASSADFLSVFKNDQNLKKLWFNEKNTDMDVSKKAYKNKEKALQEINAYQETQRWLQQWSGGNVKNLHKVEWLALRGMVRKYKKHLTPVDSHGEFTASSPFLNVYGVAHEE